MFNVEACGSNTDNTGNATEPEENNLSKTENFDSNHSNPNNVGTQRKCIPLILDRNFFNVKRSDGYNVFAEYVRCKKVIKRRIDATTNFRPHLKAIARLQGSNNTFYGDFLLQLMRIKKVITTFQLRHLKFCFTLVSVLLDSLQKRFGDYLSLYPKVNDAILASTTHLFFKLRWAPKENRNQLKEWLLNEIDCCSKSTNSLKTRTLCLTELVVKNILFDESSSENDTHTSNVRTNNLQLQVLQCLENVVDWPMLKQYPIIAQIFIKYNTPLPASAPVKRLFFYAGIIMRSKRRYRQTCIWKNCYYLRLTIIF
ncbi:hypothetical protein RN001_001947 [Aquatica leii]|uniref:HAT C-terminal dimerisation domain-containing protein n=1 Tax=Aquatica leii TaxID=1421715 RepID=A0AAN7SCZ7_9COLE|nr:hypothetical protein RN001_001947 [Aquatica leii]